MKSPHRPARPFELAVVAAALSTALALLTPPAAAQQTWAQRALLRDDLADWPEEASAHAGVGAFDRAAEALERAADQAPDGDAAFALRERALKVRLALGDEAAAARDLERSVALARQGSEAASRAWRLVELLGAACERQADVHVPTMNTQLRRCEGLYRTWLRRLGLRLPLDVRVRARVALARVLWRLGIDVGARHEARLALDAWRAATGDPLEDPWVDRDDPAPAYLRLFYARDLGMERLEACVRRAEAIRLRADNATPYSRATRLIDMHWGACGRAAFGPLHAWVTSGGGVSAASVPPWFIDPAGALQPRESGAARTQEAWMEGGTVERAREAIGELRYRLAGETAFLLSQHDWLHNGNFSCSNDPLGTDDFRMWVAGDLARLTRARHVRERFLLRPQVVVAARTGVAPWDLHAVALHARGAAENLRAFAWGARSECEQCAEGGPPCGGVRAPPTPLSFSVGGFGRSCLWAALSDRNAAVVAACGEVVSDHMPGAGDREIAPAVGGR